MADTQLVLILFAVAGVALSIGLMREYVLPRLYRRRLVHSIALALDVEHSRNADGTALLTGELNGCRVKISVSRVGSAVVTVPLSERAVPHDLSVYETSHWSYQKTENRLLGLTINTGDVEFDRGFDVHSDDPAAARKVAEHFRRTLVAHRRPGLMIVRGDLILGSGGATPFGYFHQRPDTLDGVMQLVSAATSLARDLQH